MLKRDEIVPKARFLTICLKDLNSIKWSGPLRRSISMICLDGAGLSRDQIPT
jgi:hypothetical protein